MLHFYTFHRLFLALEQQVALKTCDSCRILNILVIWTAQGKYLTMNSTEETAGRHSGIFWAISQACLSCGGIFLFFVFNSGSTTTISDTKIHVIYGVFTSVTVLGIVLLGLLRMPTTIDETNENAPSLPPTQEPQLTQLELLSKQSNFKGKIITCCFQNQH